MDDKELEKKLKDSADNIEMQDFSVRWTNIKERIELAKTDNCRSVICEQPVLVSNCGNAVHLKHNRRKITFTVTGIALLFIAVVLSIVLPLTLSKNDTRFYSLRELKSISVDQNSFYREVENSHYETVDFSRYEVTAYYLFYTKENQVKGAGCECFDEESLSYMTVDFFDDTVLIDEEFNSKYKEYSVKNVKIKYETEIIDGAYSTVAYAQYKNMSYKIECMSLNESVTDLFDILFG